MNQQMSRDEQVGFHKGAIDTLLKERAELLKMASVVTKITEMHVDALKKLGVDLTQEIEAAQQSSPQPQTPEPQTPKTKSKKQNDDFATFY
jgi:hypothetical protein